MFETGEYVVYGHVGICEVKGVTTMQQEGVPADRLYYVLQPEKKSEGTIYTPVDNMRMGLRRMMTKAEAAELIEEIPSIEALDIKNDKQREECYKECLRSCDVIEMVRMIKSIYNRKIQRFKMGKKNTAVDERYMKMAEDSLYTELSILLDIPREKMVDYISDKIEGH